MGQFSNYTWLLVALTVAPIFATDNVVANTYLPLASSGTYEVLEDDFVYAKIGDLELRAHSYRPKLANSSNLMRAVVDVHGGAWNLYDRMAGDLYNKALASAGLYVLAIDFRQGSQFKHPLGSRDSAAAIRYLKTHSKQLQIGAERMGLVGSSSGGHLALLAGLLPDTEAHKGTPIILESGVAGSADDVSAQVDYIIALWPVSDPLYRFEYAKRIKREELLTAHLNYFGNVDAMREANVMRVLDAKEATRPLPNLLVVQPGDDKNIPREMMFDLLTSYQNAGGQVDYAFFPGQPHAFAHRPSAATDDCINLMIGFISRQFQ